MSTRKKVFNYVLTADPGEVKRTLDEARSMLTARLKVSLPKPLSTTAKPKAKPKPEAEADLNIGTL